MASGRRGARLAVIVGLLLATAGCVAAGSDTVERVAANGSAKVAALAVRKVAIGTWHCTEAYDEDITQDLLIGIAPDGRWGTGRTGDRRLREAGTWKLDGLQLEVEFPLTVQGVSVPTGLTYTGDADPPTRIHVVDHANGDSEGEFAVTVRPDTFAAQQSLTYGGVEHTKRYECDKRSGKIPKLRPAS